MYQNYSVWDKLNICIVGRAWGPDFYKRIANAKLRSTMEQVALETEEDLQSLVHCLESLGVTVYRPNIIDCNLISGFPQAPMLPRDHLLMLGNLLTVLDTNLHNTSTYYQDIINLVKSNGNAVTKTDVTSICGAMVYQLDQSVFFSTWDKDTQVGDAGGFLRNNTSNRQVNKIHLHGHIDGWFCPVTPGLIIACDDPVRPELLRLFFKRYFANWEIVYLQPSLRNNTSFNTWQKQSNSNWWLPSAAGQTEVIELIDSYFKNWLGDVNETAFEVNMLIVDSKNVITSYYNKEVFDALKRHNVTPHLVNLRHHTFWDGGVHCVTTDLHRTN